MKKSALLASMIAASATAVGTTTSTTSSSSVKFPPPAAHQEIEWIHEREESTREKFTPRFDGLRFIETLVTAHR